MNKLVSLIQYLRLDRVVIVLLAGVLMLITTACGSPADKVSDANVKIPTSYSSGTAGNANQRVGKQTELYDPIQKRQGGMNEYSDVDPRVNMKPVNQKAQDLVENAEYNVNKVQDPGDFVDAYRSGAPLGKRVENVVDRVTGAAENTAEGVTKGARRGVENVKENAADTRQEVPEVVKQGGRNAADTAKNLGDRVNGNRQTVNTPSQGANNNFD